MGNTMKDLTTCSLLDTRVGDYWWKGAALRAGLDPAGWERAPLTWDQVAEFLDIPFITVPLTDPNFPNHVRVTRADDRTVTIGDPRGKGYTVHLPKLWLAETVYPLVEVANKEGLYLESCNAFYGGALTAITLALPEDTVSADGYAFRSKLNAFTSADSSLATQVGTSDTTTVCRNTIMFANASMTAVTGKVRHTKNSNAKRADYAQTVADRLGMSQATKASIDMLGSIPCTDAQWDKVLATMFAPGKDSAQSKTISSNSISEARSLYRHDVRCEPWKGTALGVWQTLNTWAEHYQTVRNADRCYRSAVNAVLCKTEDSKILNIIGSVLDDSRISALAA